MKTFVTRSPAVENFHGFYRNMFTPKQPVYCQRITLFQANFKTVCTQRKQHCYKLSLSLTLTLLNFVFRHITGGAGSRGGRGRDCDKKSQWGTSWNTYYCDDDGYEGRGPNGPPGIDGKDGTSKRKNPSISR